MKLLIADTFTDSLARLTTDEQKAVKTTAFDLQLDPASPGMKFHKLDRAKDKNFWSVRVSGDIRLIAHKTQGSLLLCYVDHHDRAYEWAARRKLETHPSTGAAQLVEIRETVQEVVVPVYVEPRRSKSPQPPILFHDITDEQLLGYGLPAEWLIDVRSATEETLLALADRLPAEAAEALLELATGGKPRVPKPVGKVTPFEHPDAQRRFRVIASFDELARALDYPWEKWTVFLHPDQREWVERDYNGPARVSGSAGTGKTIVGLHRAVSLARANPESRVLLTTFSDTLAHVLKLRLTQLIGNEPRVAERIEVTSTNSVGLRLYRARLGPATIAAHGEIVDLVRTAAAAVHGHKFGLSFLFSEWEQLVDAWQLLEWEAYRDAPRLGRKTRLSEPQRKGLWSIFERVWEGLRARGAITHAALFSSLAAAIAAGESRPFDFVVVDEAQDVTVAQLRFFAALGGDRPNALFFAGDLGQRIFQQPFSWKALGVDIRGRSRTLRVNYRTSHQIRAQADRLLGPELTDVDGNTEKRSDAVSVFNGPAPTIRAFKNQAEEIQFVGGWIAEQTKSGVRPQEIGLFVRSTAERDRAIAAARRAGLLYVLLDDQAEPAAGSVSISSMHVAKGLEFRAVAVMACDDEVIPLQERVEAVGDAADLQEVYDSERHLLYVACTRARDLLLLTGVEPVSEFLDDLQS
jgi:mRNA-degrading endonuclease RelE of RelBE toxin-antitoxin system